MRTCLRSFALVALTLLAFCRIAFAQEEHEHAPAERLGAVHFETSCAPGVAASFDRAVALLHSFWFGAAREEFERVALADPSCAMAWWGVALAQWGNPFGGYRSPAALEAGSDAIVKARAATTATPRERLYVGAAAALFEDHAAIEQRTRTLAYQRAMEELSKQHPQDDEAAIFYALALAQTALPTDKTYANNLAAAAILESLLPTHPDHPGIAHYIIHSYDVPSLAPRALEAARRYSEIAPSAPHALHMPSHTFTRVGYWQESIDANLASAAAARREGGAVEELHALDYQVYAYLQTGQDEAARDVLEQLPSAAARLAAATANAAPLPAAYFALAAIPARLALERGEWRVAAALPVSPSPFAWADAVTHFARALGAARSGQPGAAREDLARLIAIRDTLAARKEAYWSEQVEIQRLATEAWIRFAEGEQQDAIALLRSAADAEDETEKHAVTPGPLAPAREQLGEMLLEAGRPTEALRELEATVRKEPNRFRGLFDAARAASVAGDGEKAKLYAQQLLETARGSARPELTEARRWAQGS